MPTVKYLVLPIHRPDFHKPVPCPNLEPATSAVAVDSRHRHSANGGGVLQSQSSPQQRSSSDNIMEMYTGNKSGDDFPGRFPYPYYWWESGAVMGALIDYWAFTGDTGNNPAVTQALIHQAGDDRNYVQTHQRHAGTRQ
ncbi:hypothetical protein L211DRAFT_869124 [Terfezia boudieri ATCC MYA-4762]|uniref:mannan endo-1,6-alpha-mannosidase n=1 Tax=Terfezia boudieri ATCC MYA-4762 TaxID=1051890 RepID=A0A3N4LLI9_9PEZI|nr:hypothetical protein L211DRAFT_869124 [Terfezia boudieri ATCC MYA-4762]